MSSDSDESNFLLILILTSNSLSSNCTPRINDIQLDKSNEFLDNSFELHSNYIGDSYSYKSFSDSDPENNEENHSKCKLDFKLREWASNNCLPFIMLT